ncbi:ABC transporter substrate-binding protein [Rhizobium sp. LC145]|jgi:putative spermidine/putrescine transport system substrate-binding protein|uniref:ABC transporter substrate-binding protein n=1 Tax=Rhizobium sp. LC145 TaxID=1120688 RepID=UPI00062A300A|nr:ABC transporter substrate-binding protein [Rhizobium sp. LC145]KKX33217.1 polyamine ABC transporter substrate-binding protein [Rhizobium sp. LC145]TKT68621.1 ABC transporter substrate-binding protein [Rhizobiaceae bacterium LC148]
MLARLSIAVSILALGAATGAAAETVTITAYSGIFQDHYTKAVVEPFMKKNPDIKVEFYGLPNSAQMLGTLRAQKDSPQIDVAILDISVAKAGADEGLFEKVDESVSANVKDLYPNAFAEGVAGVAVTFDNLVLIYNTDQIKKAPTSWNALWDQNYAGKLVIPAVPDIQGTTLTIIANRLAGGGDYKENVDAGIEKLGELAPGVQTWEPKPDVYTPIANGQAAIGIGWNARAQIYSGTSGGKMAVVLPEEGSGFQINTINLVKNAPAGDAAKKFIDYALSPEAQAAFTAEMFYAPTNSKAQVSGEALQRTAAGQMDKMIDIDWLAVAKIRDSITEKWRRQVIPLSR